MTTARPTASRPHAGGETVVEDETAEFNFASDNDTYWTRERNPDFISHCEAFFERKRLSEPGALGHAYLPVYFATPGGTRMVVTETDLEDYPCMFLFGGEGRRLRAEFPPVVLESRLEGGFGPQRGSFSARPTTSP